MRQRAIDLLRQQNPKTAAGFLGDALAYEHVANTLNLSANHTLSQPQTILTLNYEGSEGDADRQRMAALVKSLIGENAASVDSGRRLQDVADRAIREVIDDQKKVDQLKAQIAVAQRTANLGPTSDQLFQLEQSEKKLEKASNDAVHALDMDQVTLERLQAAAAGTKAPAAGAAASTAPADPQLEQMRKDMNDLTARLQAAKGEESAGAADARKQLEASVQQFNDQLTAAGVVLDDGSQLKIFVDSAKDAQVKAHELITALIVDGEDLEKQLEDTRRDMEELIQSRQKQKFAADAKLHQLQDNLDSAQHRYNAAVGEGLKDPKILDPLQREITVWTTQIKMRQGELGVEAGEVKIQEDMNKLIDSLRGKLAREKHQIDQVLDPLEKQFNDLGPAVASLPNSQQDLAKQLHDRLAALNESRRRYAQAVGDSGAAPSAKVTDLQKQLEGLKTQYDRRQSDLTAQLEKSTVDQRGLAAAQQKVEDDKKILDEANKAYDAARVKYRDAAGRREDAQVAQAGLKNLNDELQRAAVGLEAAVRDRDLKQVAAGNAYTIKPFDEAKDIQFTTVDRRKDYWSYSLAGLALLFAILVFAAHGGPDPVIIPGRQTPPNGAGTVRAGADPLSIPSPGSSGNGHSDDEALTI